jgi:YD repeat-containing protein
MPKKLFSFVLTLFIISATAATISASEETVFGPQNLEIRWWRFHLSRHRFNVDTPGEANLNIIKNALDKKFYGGVLIFNGVFFPLRNLLTNNQAIFQTSIQLSSVNRMIVFLRGDLGASIQIEITKTSPIPLPQVSFSADPESINRGRSSTLSWSATNAEKCVIEPAIGNVDTNGSIFVSPLQDTTYTLTATGPGGTASDSVTVFVTSTEDLDYGLNFDEQQDGGGLIGETIRILNGNAVEFRLDLNFASSHRFGLLFAATYNSRVSSQGSFGFGWTHSYAVSLNPDFKFSTENFVKIVDQTGRAAYFKEETAGFYKGQFGEKTHVTVVTGEYVWHRLNGFRYGFSVTGRLLWIEDEKRNRLIMDYGAQERLEVVADQASGRTLTFNYNSNGLLESISGPVVPEVANGIYVTYGYDADQNLISVTYPDDSGFTYEYSDPMDSHNLTGKRNTSDHLINTWTYDNQDRCVDNFNVQGTGVSVNYATNTRADVTDAYGARRTYTIKEVNNRRRVTAMQGIAGAPYTDYNIVRWVYDNKINLIEVETAGGTIHQYLNHDDRGNPQTVIFAAGTLEEQLITYTYHPAMNVALNRSEESVLGNDDKVTIWDYDDDSNATANENPINLLHRIIEQGFTADADGRVIPYEYITTFTYNPKGQVESIDGPLAGTGDITTLTYDTGTGNVMSVTRPLIGTTSFSDYDAVGKLGRLTDVNDQSQAFTYDGMERIIAVTHEADNSTSSVSYNTAGLPETITDEDGVLRSYDYDPVYGRLIQKTDMEGNSIVYTYDVQGNLIEMVKHDLSGTRTSRKRWSYKHPVIPGRIWKQINADDTYTEYDYDSEGNIISVTDFNGNTTTYGYDPLNRLVAISQPNGVLTSFSYDLHGNLVSVIDAEGNRTNYMYDDMGRVVSATSPDTGTTNYVYDAAGNPIKETDAKGNAVVYSYDLLNRLEAARFPDSRDDITYTYDKGTYGVGRRTGITGPAGKIAFDYDSRGRLIGKTSTVNGYSHPVSRTFTPGGRLLSFIYTSGRTIDYNRYTSGRIQKVTTTYNANTVALVDNLSYNPFGTTKGLETGAGGTVNNVSNENESLATINPGKPMEQVYSYDANHNLISIRGTYTPWYNKDFNYDALNRLYHANGIYGNIEFIYDKVGNRLTRTIGGQTETYTYYPGTNKLYQTTGLGEPVIYSYDANGNITEIGDRELAYNQNNRLIRVEENSKVLGEYAYNGLGQRVIKEVDGIATIFHYDFNGNLIAESSADGTFVTEYLYVDEARLVMIDVASDTMYYFLNNYLGTPVIMTNDQGVMAWEADYKPFGEATVNPNSEVVNNFRFVGEQLPVCWPIL